MLYGKKDVDLNEGLKFAYLRSCTFVSRKRCMPPPVE